MLCKKCGTQFENVNMLIFLLYLGSNILYDAEQTKANLSDEDNIILF